MTETSFVQKVKKFEIQSYKPPKDLSRLRKTHVPYTGSPRKHRSDPDRFILLPDPYGNRTFYYEFLIEDISYVEELPNLVNLEGETVTMTRIWIKKMSRGLQCLSFLVSDPEDKDRQDGE